MTKRVASIILGAALTGTGGFIAYAASLARGSSRYDLGPAFFPHAAGIALVILGLYTMVNEYFRGERVVIQFLNRKILLGIAAMAVYTALLRPLGYVASGVLIMTVLMILMCTDSLRKVWGRLLLVGVLAPIAIYLIFAKYLLVPLP